MPSSVVSRGLRSATPPYFYGLIRMRDVGGNTGGIVTDLWQFRLTFAGVTMAVGCQSCGFFIARDIASGTLNGSFDLNTGNCAAQLNTSALKTSACAGGAGLNSVIQLLFGQAIELAGYVTVAAVAPDTGSGVGYYFYQRAPFCDFQDGMVLNNAIVSPGCYTPPSTPLNPQGVALGTGGNVTITKLPCLSA